MLFSGILYYEVLVADFVNQDDYHYVFKVGQVWSSSWQEVMNVFTRGRFDWPPTFQNLKDVLTQGRIHRPTGTNGYYQPMAALSFMMDARITVLLSRLDSDSIVKGTTAFQFHLTNLLLHLINVALVFALVRRLSSTHLWPILLSLLFAVHPVQVESVAWVAQRMTLLGCTFTMLALNCYIRYVESLRWRWLVLVVPLYAMAVLCRPLFIGLPVILLILDVWPFRRHERRKPEPKNGLRTKQHGGGMFLRPILEKIPLFAILVIGVVIQSHIRPQEVATLDDGPDGIALLSHNTASLASRLLWPVKLSPYHPISTTVGGISLGHWFDVGVLALAAVALIWSFCYRKPVFVALTGAVIFVLPALLQAPHSELLLSDQYLYGVLIIPVVAFAAWLKSQRDVVRRRWGRWTAIVLTAVIAILSVQSYAQTLIWQSDRDLYENTTKLYPDWGFGYIGLVESYIHENDFDPALKMAQKAVEVEPDNPSTQFYLGTVLLLYRDSRSREAIAPLRKALVSNPNWIECLQNLGVALGKSGRTDEAIEYFEKARDLDPHSAGVRIGLGNAYLKVNRYASARGEFQEALKHRNDSSAHLGLAIAWAANNTPEYARRHLAAAVAKDPKAAMRAGHSLHLRRFLHLPEFDALIEDSVELPVFDDASIIESPTARSAHGS